MLAKTARLEETIDQSSNFMFKCDTAGPSCGVIAYEVQPSGTRTGEHTGPYAEAVICVSPSVALHESTVVGYPDSLQNMDWEHRVGWIPIISVP